MDDPDLVLAQPQAIQTRTKEHTPSPIQPKLRDDFLSPSYFWQCWHAQRELLESR